jgi:hypothetical protein
MCISYAGRRTSTCPSSSSVSWLPFSSLEATLLTIDVVRCLELSFSCPAGRISVMPMDLESPDGGGGGGIRVASLSVLAAEVFGPVYGCDIS